MATHSCTLAWRIPRKEAPGGLQSMGLGKLGHPAGRTEGRIGGRKSGWATGLLPPCSEQTRAWELEGRWLCATVDSGLTVSSLDKLRMVSESQFSHL